MKPFVARFGRPILRAAAENDSLKYDFERESIVLAGNSALAIESPEALPTFTGSICTRAAVDTTADEASDR
jgi:hypothetical protein